MTFPKAVRILMESATRDVGGCGRGFRSTPEEWRVTVAEAWVVCFRRVYRREPNAHDLFNAGMGMHIKSEEAPDAK